MKRTLSDWLVHIEQQHPKSVDMELVRLRAMSARMSLGRPARCVITVGGTNGKGSTVAFIEAIARAAGLRVGAYTSPHLQRYNERVRIEGEDASDVALVEALEAVDAVRGDTPLTYFEYTTLAALWLFERADLDLVVLEVGLGGRLDATNLVDADVAVITTVDLDHQDYLGDDREVIGAEKAGIARAWKPLVLGDDDPPSSVLRHAYTIGASALRIGCDFFFEPLDATQWRWRDVDVVFDLPRPAHLTAPVQLRNAAVAIAALRATPFDIDETAMARGLRSARVRGRLQTVERDGVRILVDVAHNPQAARALAEWLRATREPGSRTLAVYAALRDKDAAGVVDALAENIDAWHLAGLGAHGARGGDVAELASRLQHTAARAAERYEDAGAALQAALQQARAGDRVLVFGSFHTAADALQLLGEG